MFNHTEQARTQLWVRVWVFFLQLKGCGLHKHIYNLMGGFSNPPAYGPAEHLITVCYSPPVLQKLNERRSALNKSNMVEKYKEKWRKVMDHTFMSSEESGGEDIIVVKPLRWRAEKVTNFFHHLDDKITTSKSPQARRQRKARIISTAESDRPQPAKDEFPAWSLID